MKPEDIVLVGVKGAALAFHRGTGRHLWATELKSGSTSDFVTLAADDARAYAHTGGELFCLDLQTGRILWRDGLKGFGYGLASIAFPGVAQSPAAAEVVRQAAAANASTTASMNPSQS